MTPLDIFRLFGFDNLRFNECVGFPQYLTLPPMSASEMFYTENIPVVLKQMLMLRYV